MKLPVVLQKIAQDLRASYWFIPIVLVVAAIVLAQVLLYLDRHHDVLPFELPKAFVSTQADGARSTLSVMSQSMIGAAGVMFSMTIVAVSFAAGNFGPRLIGNFMKDRGNQWSLGILISTFVYTLLILRAVQNPNEAVGADYVALFVPHIAIAGAFVLSVISVVTMIYYVHHVPETINVANITATLGKNLSAGVRDLIDNQNTDEPLTTLPDREPDHILALDQSGYVQTLDYERLEALAHVSDWQVEVVKGVGDFVVPGQPTLRFWAKDGADSEGKEALLDCFAMGHTRTESQNLLFIVDQLVEMIARAMSPGVNDPFTAINCVNWLHTALAIAADHDGGLHPRQTGPVHRPQLSFRALLVQSLGSALPYIAPDPLCAVHLAGVLSELKKSARTHDERELVKSLEAQLVNQGDDRQATQKK